MRPDALSMACSDVFQQLRSCFTILFRERGREGLRVSKVSDICSFSDKAQAIAASLRHKWANARRLSEPVAIVGLSRFWV